tara:strand:- start:1322 stop:2020 length:699 start_codon:yes stop_codon:yes gene_type:complete
MKKITINLSFYNQDKTLLEQVRGWLSWPPEIKKYYSFCIVDDCSKNNALKVLRDVDLSCIDLSIYRVKEDLFCNIAGVRNLAASLCETEWMMIIDMDTVVPVNLSRDILDLCNSPPKYCYKFNRKVIKNRFHIKNGKEHPAVCLIRKEDYWNIGGCEEDLVGNYGQTDPIFWYRATGKIKVEYKKNMFLNYLPKGSAKIKRNKYKNLKLFEQKKIDGNWSKDFIRFAWEKIY